MTPEEFQRKLIKMQDNLSDFINSKAPKLIGKIAVDHFKNNFIKGEFDGNKWQMPKRFNQDGSYAGEKYGPLLSATTELMNSLTYKAAQGRVVISSDKAYAQIHNEGGTINVPVTEKMKKFAWAKHRELTENSKEKNSMWKGIALTKKQSLKINMPRRQFIGYSKELDEAITKKIEENMTKILS